MTTASQTVTTTTELAKAIGSHIALHRKSRGLSHQQLADRAGFASVQVLKNIECGWYGGMRVDTVHRIAVALGVVVGDLFPNRWERK